MTGFFDSCKAVLLDGSTVSIPVSMEQNGSIVRLCAEVAGMENIEYIDFGKELIRPCSGDNGYFVVSAGHHHDEDNFITYFSERKDGEYITKGKTYFLPVFGVRHPSFSFSARVDGMKEIYRLVVGVENGSYYLYPRFVLGGDVPYEDISVEYTLLPFEEATYSRIAEVYRDYLLDNGICKKINDRLTPALEYASESLYIRIRQCWKPVPTKVAEQTEENEPDIHVACTFESVSRLMDECKRQGIDKAEFCLVGFNKSGHDGRWPQIFPVEPLLGGEEELKKLIAHAKELGYRISCHTNSTEGYSIADSYNTDELLIDKHGNYQVDPKMWGGGTPRKVCPVCAYETAKKELPKIAALGFDGMHYIDVLSIEHLLHCYSDKHPCNEKQSAEYNRKMGQLCRDLFGGYSSEGGRDHSAPVTDFALYVSYHSFGTQYTQFADRDIPLWQLIFHGIVLGNPYAQTNNLNIRPALNRFVAAAYGARPVYYFYSKFHPNFDWVDMPDMRCKTDEERVASVAMMKEIYDVFKSCAYLQRELMIEHEFLEGDKVKVTYSDGSIMIVDYEKLCMKLFKDGVTVCEYEYKGD